MSDDAKLLIDLEVQQFIVTGCKIVHADYSAGFHATILDKIETVFEEEGNLGNNILPRIPDIGQLFEHPNVKGALTSLLGEGYIMNPHRHCHLNPAGSKGQNWHKDCYVYDHNLRHPRFDWVLAFYYPQDTTEDMGPSAVLPCTQNLKTISSPNPAKAEEEPLAITGPAGTIGLIHFDSWHRAFPNVSDKNRYMLKFQFARTAVHEIPTWDHKSTVWSPGVPDGQPRVSQDVWGWLVGKDEAPGKANASPDRLFEQMEDVQEQSRLNASYDLGSYDAAGIPELITSLRDQSISTIEETTAKTPDNAHGTNPTPSPAALALSSIGRQAVRPVAQLLKDDSWWVRAVAANVLYRIGKVASDVVSDLVAACDDGHWWVRRNAIEALTEVGRFTDDVVDKITAGLSDEDYRVRRSACLGVGRLGSLAAGAVSLVASVLDDENRYNRFYATLALRRIGTPEAQDRLIDALIVSRWCPITTKDDRF
jgi:hypothetical protein